MTWPKNIPLLIGCALALGNPVVLAKPELAPVRHDPTASRPGREPLASPGTTAATDHDAVNSTLRGNPRALDTSNLLRTVHDLGKSLPNEHTVRFETGRELRAKKDFAAAMLQFELILKGDAPEEMKRTSLLELALMAQEQEQLPRAVQVLAQFLKSYPEDPSVPEVLLRQGLIYREMGVPLLALSKFYAVMTSSITFKNGNMDYYRKLVLHAQTEIAETYYQQGKFSDAIEFLTRLLKQNDAELNRERVQIKLLRSYAALGQDSETIGQATSYLEHYPQAEERAEAHFLLATAYKNLGQVQSSLRQVLALLKPARPPAQAAAAHWTYWQQRAGNNLANQLYHEGDYLNALEVYSAMAALNEAPAWQLPVLYQVGLIFERLQQPSKAVEIYAGIAARQKDLPADATVGLRTVVEMAHWRSDVLKWQRQVETSIQTNASVRAIAPVE